MISVYDSKFECCGCEACRQICPQQCIHMREDENGFLYPHIDQNKCVDCGLCRKSCPYHNSVIKHAADKCYMYLHKDERYRLASASSGAFEAVCRAFSLKTQEEDIIVFGCELTTELVVQHSYSIGFSGIGKFKKSKYVQSRINDSYINVRKFLEAGKRVVFSGTPCQIMGLRLFLKKEYANLLLVDIICHGVPNQRTFNKYLDAISKRQGSKIEEFEFRHKVRDSNQIYSCLNTRARFKNGTVISLNCSNDMFMSTFLAGILNRDACSQCPFASIERVSDVTLGDFWGIGSYMPKYSEQLTSGTSLVLFNTAKGKQVGSVLEKEANSICIEFNVDMAVKYNDQLSHPQKFDGRRDLFFKRLKGHNGFMRAMRACFPERYGIVVCIRNSIYSLTLYKKLSRIKNKLVKYISK